MARPSLQGQSSARRTLRSTSCALPVPSSGARYLGQQAGIAIAIDLVWVVLFAIHLLAARKAPA